MTNADGSDATSVQQCWDLCSAQYGSSLVAVDRWPNNVHIGLPAVLLPEWVHEHLEEHVDDAGVELALKAWLHPSSSGLTSCVSPPPPPRSSFHGAPASSSGSSRASRFSSSHLRRRLVACPQPTP